MRAVVLRLVVVILLGGLCAVAHGATVYSCVGPDGIRHIADRPCDQLERAPYECTPVNGVRTFAQACAPVAPHESSSFARRAAVPGTRTIISPNQLEDANQALAVGARDTWKVMRDLDGLWLLGLLALLGVLPSMATMLGWPVLRRLLWARVAGTLGEWRVRRRLASLPESAFTALNDVYLEDSRGLTQIDHVVIARDGVHVIETKNLSGWLFGRAGDREWTQVIFRFHHRFQNPIHQNFRHVHAVAEALNIPESHCHSLVVLSGRAELRTSVGPNVIYLEGLASYFRQMRPVLWSEPERRRHVEALSARQLPRSRATRKRHRSELGARHRVRGAGSVEPGESAADT